MKIVLGAAAAVMLLAGVAMAQTDGAPPTVAPAQTTCANVGAAPVAPNGESASADEINAFNTLYQTWGESVRTALNCRRTEIQTHEAAARTLLEEHNALAAQLNTLTETWRVESEEYCQQRGVRCQGR